MNEVQGREGLGYIQTRWEEDTLNNRGIYKDSKWPGLYDRLETWADGNGYLELPVLKYLFVPGSYLWLYLALAAILVIVEKAILSATGGDRRILWDDAVRPHGADAICLSGDAGTAVSGGADVRNRPEDGK